MTKKEETQENKKADIPKTEETIEAVDEKKLAECLTEENEALIAENEAIKVENAKLQEEKDDAVETLQRHQAEFENFRKRTMKEKEELRVVSQGNLLADLLPVLDNFYRVLEHADDSPVVEGIIMVQKQMLDILFSNGLLIIGGEGEEFDPKIHDAVMQEERPGFAPNTITEVLQPGYVFNERLLRPAMVKVQP